MNKKLYDFFIKLLKGLKYWCIQGVVEFIIILCLEYLGFGVLNEFSKHNLFIENAQFIIWIIAYKTIVLSGFYLFLFLILSYTFKRVKYCYLNLVVAQIWFLLMVTDGFEQAVMLFVSCMLSSIIILMVAKWSKFYRLR